jgi:FdhD protein
MLNKKVKATKYVSGKPKEIVETLALEEALQIKINGRAYTITMRSPGKDFLLTAGLLFTEGIIRSPEDIFTLTQIPAPKGEHTLIIDVSLPEEIVQGKNLFNRSIASSASCGVCGKTELCDLITPEYTIHTTHQLNSSLIPLLIQKMNSRQETFDQTGGSHAAAIFSITGELLSLQEDIGRHNAVDKAIGELFLNKKLAEAAILLVSGRVSYEIVTKCAQAKLPFLLAVSAPSSLAVELCDRKGITLVGFCRENRATVYTHTKRIVPQTLPYNQPYETYLHPSSPQ